MSVRGDDELGRSPGARERRRRAVVGVLLGAVVWAACTVAPVYFVAPGHEGAPGVRRVLLCAPNAIVALRPEIAHGAKLVERELTAYLEARALVVERLGLSEARWHWQKAVAAAGQGQGGDTAAAFVGRLAQERVFDVLMLPSVVLQSVQVTDNSGSWDGVRRSVVVVNAPVAAVGRSTDTFVKGLATGGITGPVLASSVHVLAYSARGERVFEGRGGLEFVQEYDLSQAASYRGELRVPPEAFRNRKVLRQGVEIALAPYLPPLDR